MKRQIISIDKSLCNGCGACVTGCSEGALKIVDGKAKLVKDNFCDGFGDCIGECPTGALTIETREAPGFDEKGTKKHLLKTRGKEGVKRMEEAQKKHAGKAKKHSTTECGCSGSKMMEFKRDDAPASKNEKDISSELTQWPVQIHLVNPSAPYFKNKELVVLSTCSPIASANIHAKYLKGRSVVVGCPKLDNTEPYAEKISQIIKEGKIKKIIIVIMEVPCCNGLVSILNEAIAFANNPKINIEIHTMGLDGTLKDVEKL